jgi:hypothetical protein
MRLPAARVVLSPLGYLWAAPNTLLGLVFVGLALASCGRVARVGSAIEAHGGWVGRLLAHAVPVRGGADALTLGHVVLGQNPDSLERQRAHERVHVRQCERWGPLFLPAYACASLVAWLRGGDPYLDNRFEREARERSEPVREA